MRKSGFLTADERQTLVELSREGGAAESLGHRHPAAQHARGRRLHRAAIRHQHCQPSGADRAAFSHKAPHPRPCRQRPPPPCQGGPRMARTAGLPRQASLCPALLSASQPDRTPLGPDAEDAHPQPMFDVVSSLPDRGPDLPAKNRPGTVGNLLRCRQRKFPRQRPRNAPYPQVNRVLVPFSKRTASFFRQPPRHPPRDARSVCAHGDRGSACAAE